MQHPLYPDSGGLFSCMIWQSSGIHGIGAQLDYQQ
jgi:hypothetical protein